MHELTIYRRYFFESSCYQSGRPIAPIGVQVHSTGANNPWLRRYVAPDDGRIGKNAYGNDHNRAGDVCAHAYIGRQADGTVAVYQTLPWDMRCWLSGSGPKGNANKLGYIGFEVCEDGKTDEEYFRAVMDAAAMLTAYLCQEYGLDPETQVKDHRELHDLGLASNHSDITHWLIMHDENMTRFRGAVSGYIAQGVEANYIDCDEVSALYQATVTSENYLNLRAGKSKSYASLARLSKGTVVDVINDADPEWWYVRSAGITGYVMRMYLAVPEQPLEGDAQNSASAEASADDTNAGRKSLTLENLTALKALLVPLLQEVEAAIQTLKGGETA